jgi:phosphoglycolate phosphatase-like HAD superfamily hydrolase
MDYRIIILDFDGVIVESNPIKHRAFAELFKDYPYKLKEIMDYHLAHNAVNRHDKFRYIMENILRRTYEPKLTEIWAKRFSELTRTAIINCPYVKGALDFIQCFQAVYPIYLASATPQDELQVILEGRKIYGYFKKVFGAPTSKLEMFQVIADAEKARPENLLFIGDSSEDWEIARQFGCGFIARKSEHRMPTSGTKVFNDLAEMKPYVQNILKRKI